MLGDGLSADQFGRLSRRYGSIQKAGVAAFKSGRCAEDFRLLAVQLVVDDGTERLEFFDDLSGQVSMLVWLAAEPDLEAEPEHAPPAPKKPRHRHPDGISRETVKRLKWELAQRKQELAQRKKRGEREYTQEKIASRLELSRPRIQQAEQLQRVGWDLLISHPEFSAVQDPVRWPSPTVAARLLASERDADR